MWPEAVVPLPTGVDARDACLVEPIAIAVHGFRMIGLRGGMRVAVIGGGTIGQAALAVARLTGCETAIVRAPRRAEGSCRASGRRAPERRALRRRGGRRRHVFGPGRRRRALPPRRHHAAARHLLGRDGATRHGRLREGDPGGAVHDVRALRSQPRRGYRGRLCSRSCPTCPPPSSPTASRWTPPPKRSPRHPTAPPAPSRSSWNRDGTVVDWGVR